MPLSRLCPFRFLVLSTLRGPPCPQRCLSPLAVPVPQSLGIYGRPQSTAPSECPHPPHLAFTTSTHLISVPSSLPDPGSHSDSGSDPWAPSRSAILLGAPAQRPHRGHAFPDVLTTFVSLWRKPRPPAQNPAACSLMPASPASCPLLT